MNNEILRFFEEKEADFKGRMYSDIMNMSDYQLEIVHDYIQVLFPIPEPSRFNNNSPILTEEEAALIRDSTIARTSFIKAANKMYGFYSKYNHWCRYEDHNLLRITRIIRSIALILGIEYANKAYEKFIELCTKNDFEVDQETLNYWILAKSGIALHITNGDNV